ncbi:ATP synthase F1 subcomplex gamma subunit [Saccharicrinis carchari]|uniref:ATP synthase gamma chain n=1 Tax=Saccharicrinis carchari TaxID=1168039 RepID=A0A521CMT3_SACCC|nr:ATP synthase F1 subunit gamma [Saccharicrinis carchari]SMO60759.1 ATP synthase F1 subcomplex gamma subunit [Saccharicrinis carchari]
MANLKDIRSRIESVKTTRQVTSAMKMVSAAKLKKAQNHIVSFRPYADKLNSIVYDLLKTMDEDILIPLAQNQEADRVLIVVITSNRGLCGAFNSHVVKEVNLLVKEKFPSHYKNNFIDFWAIGKQGEKLLKSAGISCAQQFNDIYVQPDFNKVADISHKIIGGFLNKKYDKVLLVYNEFLTPGQQKVNIEQFLPLELPEPDSLHLSEYIYEPGQETIIQELIPKSLTTMFYRTLLDSIAAEHGARMTSMHKATDNASELIGDLKLSYNKARQSAITNEILEIVGGAEALSK